jgi:hypothetical protein
MTGGCAEVPDADGEDDGEEGDGGDPLEQAHAVTAAN